MNQEELKKILPHRNSMLLVEEAEVIDGVAHGKYQVRGDEYFLDGHFPGNPIVPGVILVEMLGQACAVLLADQIEGEDITPMFTGLKDVKFKKPVKPGDLFESRCEITKIKKPFYFAKAKGYVGDDLHIVADFSFAVL